MLPFNVIESPQRHPWACVGCMGQKGPLVNTHRELRGYGDVYVCLACDKQIAAIFGFAEGERLDELADAVRKQDEDAREIAGLREALGETQGALLTADARISEMQTQIHYLEGREHQLEERIRENASAALSLVGGGNDEAA